MGTTPTSHRIISEPIAGIGNERLQLDIGVTPEGGEAREMECGPIIVPSGFEQLSQAEVDERHVRNEKAGGIGEHCGEPLDCFGIATDSSESFSSQESMT